MQIDLESLRRHYGSLSDDELLAVERNELTDAAQKCFDEEVERRGLDEAQESEAAPDEEAYEVATSTTSVDPDWLQDAACACSFVSQPGGSAASDAENAREVLQGAGIPCQVSAVEVASSTGDQPAQLEYRVVVPGALNLKAASILDKEVFNPQLEADWRTHFASMTDGELGALNPDVICAGLVDRIARLKRAYNDEISRRFRRSAG
jgi:hypothetical protein